VGEFCEVFEENDPTKVELSENTTTWGVPADTIPTKLGGVVDPRDIIIIVKYEIKLFIMVTLVSG